MSIRIVLADDHMIVREGLSELLTRKGFQVVGEAETGYETISLVKKFHPDLVLMDITMPDLNGIEATRQILENYPRTKIVALSMHSDKRFVTNMLTAGAKGYLRKNCSSDELTTAIKSVAGGGFYVSAKIANVLGKDILRSIMSGSLEDSRKLTPKESGVLQLIAEGLTSKEIAARFGLSIKTIEKHRENISKKLDLHSVADLTKYAVREGIASGTE
ncbi:MAG TPA: response regulator transcription factor [Bacteroidota bacterium]|nr:response regulator transcription factor [Bacteroidota bacterium]